MVTLGWVCMMVTFSMGHEPLGPLVFRRVTLDWMVKEIFIAPAPGLPWNSFSGCSCTVIISGPSSNTVPPTFTALAFTLVRTMFSD